MKTLLLSTSDIQGGAFRAAYRLHAGLQSINVCSQMLVQNKFSNDPAVLSPQTTFAKGFGKFRSFVNNIPLKLYSNLSPSFYSLQWFPDLIISKVSKLNPDVINLHWVCEGYLQIETLEKFNKPLVWTLHDMWAFTGGCHYSQHCDRYTNSCGACFQLNSTKERDISRWIWHRKFKAWKNLNLTIVAPSIWLASCANSSSLFKNFPVHVIPYGIDLNKYYPIDRQIARDLLKIPQNKKIILFGATNATNNLRKGFHLLQQALQNLSNSKWQPHIELIIFGSSQPANRPDLGFQSHYLGRLSDDISLALVYSAADVFVAPSMEDNLPNTVMEAIACGIPCVAFNIGGMPDMIEHQQNGYLATPYQIDDFARGIAWLIEDKERHQKLSFRARKKVEQEFTQELQARRYLSLFTKLIEP